MRWITVAVMLSLPGMAWGDVSQGLKLLRAKQHQQANAVFSEAARDGNVAGMYYLGQSLVRGRGVDKNPEAGQQLLLEAYNQPSDFKGKIAYEIGRIYQAIPAYRDYTKAFDWFWRSVEHDYGKGHVQLYTLYHDGLGVEANMKQALFHLERAANLEYPQSMLAYAVHLKAGHYGPADRREVDIWTLKSIKTLETQSRKGSSTASVRLGRLYLSGELVDVDEDLARKWLKRGRKQGSHLAKRYLKKIGEH